MRDTTLGSPVTSATKQYLQGTTVSTARFATTFHSARSATKRTPSTSINSNGPKQRRMRALPQRTRRSWRRATCFVAFVESASLTQIREFITVHSAQWTLTRETLSIGARNVTMRLSMSIKGRGSKDLRDCQTQIKTSRNTWTPCCRSTMIWTAKT